MSQLDENELSALAGLLQPPENPQPGFDKEQDLEDLIVPNQDTEELEPLSGQTELSFSSNPISKIIFVFGGVTLGLLILWMLMNNFSNRNLTTSVSTKQSNDSEQEASTPIQPHDPENGSLKTELALAEQKRQLEKLSQDRSPTIVESPPSEPEPTPVQPTVIVQAPEPQQPTPEPKVDPYQAQARAVTLGSFGSINPSPAPEQILTTPKVEPPTTVQASYLPPPPQNLEPQEAQVIAQQNLEAPLFRQRTPNFSEMVIPAGTKAGAYLPEAIFWENNNSLVGQQFRIALAEPIRSSTGAIVAPASSLLLVSVVNYSSTGLVVLQPQAFIVNGIHLPLTDGILTIESADGDYLLAEQVHRGGRDVNSGEIALDLLGTAGDLELFDPSLSRRIERTSRRFERNRPNSRGLQKPLWVLPQNTQLQLFFSQPFPITPNPSPPHRVQLDPQQQSFEPNQKIVGLTKSQKKAIPKQIASKDITLVADSGIYLTKTPKTTHLDPRFSRHLFR